MGAKLDRSRPYGTVHGSDTGICFEQDHKEFDNEGNEFVRADKPKAPVAAAAAAPPKKAAPPASVVTKDDKGNLFKNGEVLDLEAMEAADLRALATEMGLAPHANLGAKKAIAAITAGATAHDQLSQQTE